MLVQNSALQLIDFNSIIKQGTVLCYHAPNIMNDYWFRQYVNEFSQHVDSIVCISAQSQLIHPQINSEHPNQISLFDINQEWISSLGHNDSPTLSQTLRCQQLWREGKCIGYWYQPMSNHWKHFKSWLRQLDDPHHWFTKTYPDVKDRTWVIEQMRREDPDLFYLGSRSKIFQHANNHLAYPIQWYKLNPNRELELALGHVPSKLYKFKIWSIDE
jgi:hypothetical protein